MHDKLTPQEAVECLKRIVSSMALVASPHADAALAALEGLHIYGSRFKVGDEVWFIYMGRVICEPVVGVVFAQPDEIRYWLGGGGQYGRPGADCFPTLEAAEAARRNEVKS